MPQKRYKTRLSCREILNLFKKGYYSVDPDTGTVYGQRGQAITPFPCNGYLFVRLYFDGDFKRVMAVHKLVWMWVTKAPIPRSFEVHHDDENPLNNAWVNLICLHELDHRKVHDKRGTGEAEIPF